MPEKFRICWGDSLHLLPSEGTKTLSFAQILNTHDRFIISIVDHLKIRLRVRKIPGSYPEAIYENPEQKYYDALEKTFIFIKKVKYNNKIRNMMIACEEKTDKVIIITIHPISDEGIINRIMRGRWIKYE